MMSDYILEVSNIHKRYQNRDVLKDMPSARTAADARLS